MFRAELKQNGDGAILKMEGRLVGDWANEARSLVSRGPALKRLIVDLTEVSYVDAAGEQLLTWLSTYGAVFVAKAVYIAAVCKRLRVRVQNHDTPDEMRYGGILLAQENSH